MIRKLRRAALLAVLLVAALASPAYAGRSWAASSGVMWDTAPSCSQPVLLAHTLDGGHAALRAKADPHMCPTSVTLAVYREVTPGVKWPQSLSGSQTGLLPNDGGTLHLTVVACGEQTDVTFADSAPKDLTSPSVPAVTFAWPGSWSFDTKAACVVVTPPPATTPPPVVYPSPPAVVAPPAVVPPAAQVAPPAGVGVPAAVELPRTGSGAPVGLLALTGGLCLAVGGLVLRLPRRRTR
ncbi:MAG: hypothetical protein JWO15_3745 [Sphingomonadales bacterium]|nr:hypothetical protein [Sphingomonadales bacterium]